MGALDWTFKIYANYILMLINITKPQIFKVSHLLLESKIWFVCTPDTGPAPASIKFTKER